MSRKDDHKEERWSKYAIVYDPIKIGSIDGTDTDISQAHDRAIIRAINSNYKPNEKVVGDPFCTIFIARLHIKTNEETLKSKFNAFGEILRCRVVRDIITGKSKCYAFIEFKHRSSAKEAVQEMHRVLIDNCQILVDFECERTMKGWKPRRLGGGFGGKKESGQLRFGGKDRPFQRPINITSHTSSNSKLDLKEIFRQQKKIKH